MAQPLALGNRKFKLHRRQSLSNAFLTLPLPSPVASRDLKVCLNKRGHQNSLELMPMFFMLMMVGGLTHPGACAALGVLYFVSRFFYFTGYAAGDPKKRLKIGKYGFLAILGLMVCTISFGVGLLRGGKPRTMF